MSTEPTTETKNESPSHSSRGHHPFSPSSLGSLERSPCYVSRSGDNEASRMGTLQHEAVESAELSLELSDEHADAVERALRMVASLKSMLSEAGHKVYEITEKYLNIDDEPVGKDWVGTTGGYPDKVILYEEGKSGKFVGYVLDWKFGQYAVTEAGKNRQGQAYMLGVDHLLRRGELLPGGVRGHLKECTVVFFSPHRDEEPSQHTFNVDDFDGIYNDLVGIVENAGFTRAQIALHGWGKNNAHTFKTSLNTCVFCGNLGKCPAVALLSEKIAKRYASAEAPDNILGVDETDMDAAARGLKVAGIVKTWAEAYRKRITDACFEDPDKFTPTGYKMSASNPVKVLKKAELIDYLRSRFTPQQVNDQLSVPLTNFDKILGEAAPRGQKTRAIEQFRADLTNAGLVEPSPVPVISLRMK